VTEATAVCPAGVEPEYRSVTIAVPMGPFGSSSVTITSAFVDTDDGIIIVFQAPMGLHGRNQWRVVPDVDGVRVIVREEARLTGFALLMPFILMTEKRTHTEILAKFSRKLEERLETKQGEGCEDGEGPKQSGQ
jgi:hypothetical protein